MVQLMRNGKSEQQREKMAAVKVEVEDHLEEEHGPLHKRPKVFCFSLFMFMLPQRVLFYGLAIWQQNFGLGGFAVPASQYNPLDEPSPLGLRLRKSPSLLELIQMKLSQSSSPNVGSHAHGKRQQTGSASSGEKLKAANFPASILRIGTWEYKSRYEGDLVAKCYFAKHKLVWEVLDGGLKNKIEIQWSDIMALKANYPDDAPGTLDVVLARQPLFFRETNPQPRKHTLWQTTSDFTGGQASIHKMPHLLWQWFQCRISKHGNWWHYLECPQGLLGKHFEKLTQCDPRLQFLSQQGEITLDSPYFEPRISVLDDQNEDNSELDLNRERSPSFFSLKDAASPSGAQTSSSKIDPDASGRSLESYRQETPSPCSESTNYPETRLLIRVLRDTWTVEDIKNGGMEQLKVLSNWEQIRVPVLRSSMSMSDLVSHLENRISEQGSSSNPTLSSEEWEGLQILDDINRYLFSDTQNMPDSDEKSLMSRVNSLCCLLQKDTAVDAIVQSKSDNYQDTSSVQDRADESNGIGVPTSENKVREKCSIFQDEFNVGYNQSTSMSRKDSVGDLLLNPQDSFSTSVLVQYFRRF
ncbi:hypothetical protein Sango_1702600 [Sesamum angolense]|uniref:TRF2/HOY1 PH-like domain-containing protein n=1 Tax=Sesamum angolense TaxID=2727404 RepID=A0AAE1WKZ9_9LAMI|nr:hypothetical protein Sango_1702600 [Sesamum angolense]